MKITKTKFLTFLFLNSWNCDTLKMSVCPSVCLGLIFVLIRLERSSSNSKQPQRRRSTLFHSIQFIHTSTNRQEGQTVSHTYIYKLQYLYATYLFNVFFIIIFVVVAVSMIVFIQFYLIFFFNSLTSIFLQLLSMPT